MQHVCAFTYHTNLVDEAITEKISARRPNDTFMDLIFRPILRVVTNILENFLTVIRTIYSLQLYSHRCSCDTHITVKSIKICCLEGTATAQEIEFCQVTKLRIVWAKYLADPNWVFIIILKNNKMDSLYLNIVNRE